MLHTLVPLFSRYHPPADPDPPVVDGGVALTWRMLFNWLFLFLLSWQSHHHVSSAAMESLFAALLKVFTWLSRAGWLPEDILEALQAELNKWPKHTVAALKPYEISLTRYATYAICPHRECGAVYTLDEAVKLQHCTRYVRVSTEQPDADVKAKTAKIDAQIAAHRCRVKDLSSRHRGRKPKHHGHDSANAKTNFIRETMICGTLLLQRERPVTVLPTQDEAEAAEVIAAEQRRHAEFAPMPHPRANDAEAFESAAPLSKHPVRLMPYLGVLSALKLLVARHDFERMCDLWRERCLTKDEEFDSAAEYVPPALLSDIWDGRQWFNYRYLNSRTGKPWASTPRRKTDSPQELLAQKGTLAVSLNVDWFQPHKSMGYSMGAIYMTVQNLPREERYKIENVILVALLPGPRQTSREQLQGVLRLVARELKDLVALEGVACESADEPSIGKKKLRAFLLSVVCDSPAARETSGFMSHAATINCAYCLNCSSGKNSLTNTGPYANWKLRTDETQRMHATEWCGRYGLSNDMCDPEELDDRYHHEEDAEDEDHVHEDYQRDADAADEQSREEAERDAQFIDVDAYLQPMDMDDGSMNVAVAAAAVAGADDGADDGAAAPAAGAAPASGSRNASKEPLVRVVTSSAQSAHEVKHGARYCSFLDLPYFDPVRCTPIDVMHNIFLGVAKSLMELFTKGHHYQIARAVKRTPVLAADGTQQRSPNGKLQWNEEVTPKRTVYSRPAVISKDDLLKLQLFMDTCKPPSDIGRIPAKVGSKMNHFKAEQWKLWASIFCVPALRNLKAEYDSARLADIKREQERGEHPTALTSDHITLMMTMQKLSVLLQSYTISAKQIDDVASLSIDLMRQVEALYGSRAVRPNMHFAAHLAEQLRDLGPPAGWWCNSYERYNGLVGRAPRNCSHIEIGLMKGFILMVDITHAAHAQARLAHAPSHASSAPDRADYQQILEMISGSPSNLYDYTPSDKGSQLVMSVRRTASGKQQHLYRWTGREWLHQYQRFVEARLNQGHADSEPRFSNSCGNPPRVMGNEPFPGDVYHAERYVQNVPQGDVRKGKHDYRTHIHDSYWPEWLKPLISSELLMGSLLVHFALGYTRSITSGFSGWNEGDQQLWEKSTVNEKVEHLKVNNLFHIDPYCVIYGELIIASELFGSKISTRSRRSSYVAVWSPGHVAEGSDKNAVQHNVLKYGQVQLYFTIVFQEQRHYFAVMKYFDTFDPLSYFQDGLDKEIGATFPATDMLPIDPDRFTVVPVQTICFRWFANYRLAPSQLIDPDTGQTNNFYQICPIPSKVHA
jgi:hypothetical protein